MKISARRDIDAPPEAVFAALTDFARFEAQARSNGIEVTRLGAGGPSDAAWRIVAGIRGIRRRIEARVVAFDVPRQLALRAEGEGLSALIDAEIVARAPDRSTLLIRADLTATTLKGRLLLQSLKLARGALTERLDRLLARLARAVETNP